MKTRAQSIAGIALLASVLVSCAAEDETANETPPNDDPPQDDGANPGLGLSLAGNWRSDCVLTGNNDTGAISIYTRETISLDSGSMSLEFGDYIEASCSVVAASRPGGIIHGNYSLGNTLSTSDGLDAIEFDYTLTDLDGKELSVDNILYLDGDIIYTGTGIGTANDSRPDSLRLNFPYRRQ